MLAHDGTVIRSVSESVALAHDGTVVHTGVCKFILTIVSMLLAV